MSTGKSRFFRGSMCRSLKLALYMLAALCCTCRPAQSADGLLGGLREDVREEHSGDSGSSGNGGPGDRGGNDHCQTRDCDSCDDSTWSNLVLFTLAAPFWVPYALLGDNLNNTAYFPDYPYADGMSGNFVVEKFSGHGANIWQGQFLMDDSYNFDQVNRVHGQLRIDTISRLGAEIDTTYFHEQLAGGASDELWIGNAAITYRFAQSARAQFRSGLGMRWLTDDTSTDLGFSFLYGADFFPARPWVISTLFDTGTIGSAGVIHARLTSGLQFHGCELFGGYDYLRIGHADIAGPVAGVRFWF